MLQFPNAKINLGLQITEKRADGFHNLCSIFYPVGWSDALEIIPSDSFEYSASGIAVQGNAEDNLCVKVYQWIKSQFDLPPIKIHLHKNIPIGAGLGGGSSDAAFTLKMLNKLFELGLTAESMETFIKPFGSDCAFFIKNKPVLAIGKGDEFEPIILNLKGKYLVMVYPDLFISTKEAYSGIVPKPSSHNLGEITSNSLDKCNQNVVNDFEKHLFASYPILPTIKTQLYEMGAVYASMSGSGSTMYGIFENEVELDNYFPRNFSFWKGYLQ